MSLNLVVDFELELSYLISSPLKTRRENPQKPQAPLNEISYFWSRVDHICICVFGAPLRSLRRIQLGEFEVRLAAGFLVLDSSSSPFSASYFSSKYRRAIGLYDLVSRRASSEVVLS